MCKALHVPGSPEVLTQGILSIAFVVDNNKSHGSHAVAGTSAGLPQTGLASAFVPPLPWSSHHWLALPASPNPHPPWH